VSQQLLLCTVQDVKDYIGETSQDYDDEIVDLIAAATQAFLSRTGRELVPNEPNPSTRTFDVDVDVYTERTILVGDLASFTAVAINNPDGTLFQQVDITTIVALPRRREVWRPIAELYFRPGLLGSAIFYGAPGVTGGFFGADELYDYHAAGYTIDVTGAWGFPLVPADISREVKKIAAAGLARDVKRVSRTMSEAAPGFQAAGGAMHEFPLSAEQVATRYRIPTI
jgi:hypothetical protein